MPTTDTLLGRSRTLRLLAAGLLLCAGAVPLHAQDAEITGRVLSGQDAKPIAGAVVRVRGTDLGSLAAAGGRFRITSVPPGTHVVEASAAGFRAVTRTVRVTAGEEVELRIELPVRPLEMQGIEVSVLGPTLQAQDRLETQELREANPKDSGELLRELPGVDAVRRGALGLDPSVRGLRETEIGTYIDGTRMFPAGPARMDSPLTHFDPSAISDIQVVKGPYALTWGAGNLSAIRVETRHLPEHDGVRGRAATGFDTNMNAAETVGSVAGRQGDVAYWVHGNWRDGDDYEAGDGTLVPGDFRSWEGRGKVGVDVSENSRLVFSGGYQDQGPIDTPGRLLTARLFETLNLAGRWELETDDGTLRSFEVMGYLNDVHHEMDNSGKPTAEPMEGRVPPFALDIFVDSDATVQGGRVGAQLALSENWGMKTGADVYSVNRNAVRTIERERDQQLLFEDLMWPDARITDAGAYTRVTRDFGERVEASGTVRLDVVRANADTASQFLRENTGGDFDDSEVNLSGAFSLGVGLTSHWSMNLGVGSAVRTADATERYSDRIPATKAQTSAEFVGTPQLEPERSTQVDLGFEGKYRDLLVSVSGFGREVDDFITLRPTDLPKRLPLSPETVFRYINGEATFWGGEAQLAYSFLPGVTAQLSGAWLRGTDDTLDEPALGMHPLRGTAGLRYEHPGGRFFGEVDVTGVTEQDRVAGARGETPTDGYTIAEFRGGVEVRPGLDLRVGAENFTDEDYVNHLNAKNPFTGQQIAEPGTVFFFDLSYSFGS